MSTVKLTRMRWGNMFSYADENVIDLSETNVTQILGKNGAGKSSIPTIMEEGLYNKNSKGFKKSDIPNRVLNKPYWVDIEFYIDNDEYSLQVKKASTLKATMYCNEEDISKNTASGTISMFEELIGIDFKTFAQLVYQNTESSLQFLTATDSKRKEFLVNLFDLAEYGERYVLFSNILKSVQSDLSKIQGSIDALNRAVTMAENNSKIEVGELTPIPSDPDDLVQQVADYKAKLKDIDSYNTRVKKSNMILQKLQGQPKTKEELLSALEALEVPDDKDLTTELANINSAIRHAKSVIEKISKVGNNCPTCLQSVPEDFINKLIEENNSIIENNRLVGEKISTEIKRIQEVKKKRSEISSSIKTIEDLELQKDFNELQEEQSVESIADSIRNAEKCISSVRGEIAKARDHNKRVETNQAKLESALEQLADLETELEANVGKLALLEQNIGPLEVLKKAFSPTGLVAYKLENRVKDLETFTNDYLARLSDGRFNLAFELEKDKLNVVIYDQSSPVSMVSLSSGEKSRVLIGTLLGIRKIMQSISKTTINVLFLDEVISVLDDEGKEQLVEVLLEEEGLNTFLVSHGWRHPLVKQLEVRKDSSGISKIYG